MIQYFSGSGSKELTELEDFKKECWVSVTDPSDKEIESLVGYGLDESLLRDALDEDEVPRIEIKDGATYVFTRVPHDIQDFVETTPVLVGMTDTFVFTVASESDIFDTLITKPLRIKTSDHVGFFISAFWVIADRYDSFLQRIGKKVRSSVRRVANIRNADVLQFVRLEQTLGDFLGALVPTRAIFEKILIDKKLLPSTKHNYELLDDLALEINQLIEVSRSSSNNIENVRDAYSTILTNNLNQVIKALTALTVVLTVPTIVSSFYGMNVTLPFADHPHIFAYIAFGTIGFAAGILLLFSWRRWL